MKSESVVNGASMPMFVVPQNISIDDLDTIGPSGVRALPLAAGRNVGGHYKRHFGPSVLRAPAEQTKVATVLGN